MYKVMCGRLWKVYKKPPPVREGAALRSKGGGGREKSEAAEKASWPQGGQGGFCVVEGFSDHANCELYRVL